MKSLLSSRLTWVKIVEGVLLVLLGVLIAVLGGVYNQEIPHALTICIATFLLLDGLITLLEFWLEPKKNFMFSSLLGAIFLTAGIALSIYAAKGQDLGRDIAIFISILLTVFGGIFAIKGVIQIAYKGPIGWIIIHFLIAAFALALGICALVFSKENTLEIILIVLGCAIAVLGAIDLIFAIKKYLAKKKEEPETKKAKVKEVNAELDGEKVVIKDKSKKKSKKHKKLKQEEPKQLEDKSSKNEETKEDVKEDKSETEEQKDDDKHDEEPVVAEVIDPAPEK